MQHNAETAFIQRHTGTSQRECSCKTCANMCKQSICLGTPSDILELVKAGYGDKLAPTLWAAGRVAGIPHIPMVQIIQKQDNSCLLFKNGKCTLHEAGLKPTEGVLAHHSNTRVKPEHHLSVVVAQTWTNPMNIDTINEIVDLLKK